MFESEERRIAQRIKDYMRSKGFHGHSYIMLRNGQILDTDSYSNMINTGKIIPQDAYVDINIGWAPSKSDFYYPFLIWSDDLLDAYLSKLGKLTPATGLKYIAFVASSQYRDYLSIEVSDLDTVVDNTNLRTIVFKILDGKLISRERGLTAKEYFKIRNMYKSQRLLAGYTTDEARNILYDYYDKGNKSLAKEVARITFDYYRVFQPYTVCYDMKTWKEVDCLLIT